jgi:hypothetical protein
VARDGLAKPTLSRVAVAAGMQPTLVLPRRRRSQPGTPCRILHLPPATRVRERLRGLWTEHRFPELEDQRAVEYSAAESGVIAAAAWARLPVSKRTGGSACRAYSPQRGQSSATKTSPPPIAIEELACECRRHDPHQKA